MKKTIDTEEIMSKIRQELHQENNVENMIKETEELCQGVICDIPTIDESFNMNLERMIAQCYDFVSPRCEMKFYREINDKNVIKRLYKKIVRKMIKPIVFPMTVEQSHFNLNIVKMLELQEKQIIYLKKEIERLNQKNNGNTF